VNEGQVARGGDRADDARAVRKLVREGDIDRYWSALFVPAALREDLLALYAFNLEIARIPYLVSEPMVGQIRLQWWRDAIELASQNNRSGNPVADRFAAAIRRHDLPKRRLQAMVEARQFDLYTEPVENRAALNSYLDETSGTLFALSAHILGGKGEEMGGARLWPDGAFAGGSVPRSGGAELPAARRI
jgi:phytoene synthase